MSSSSGDKLQKVGIFGATFDPPHMGHFIAVQRAYEELGLSKVILIPANINPFKQNHRPAAPEIRLQMLRSVITEHPFLLISTIEIDRGGVSYMADTVKELQTIYPPQRVRLFLLIGADAAADFHLWKDYRLLAELTEIIIFNRPGFNLAEISGKSDFPHRTLTIPQLEISSSEIRRRIRSGLSVKYLLPPAIEQIIQREKLYLF